MQPNVRWFRWIHLLTVMTAVCIVGILSLSDSIVGPMGDVLSLTKRALQKLAAGDTVAVPRPSLPFAGDTVMHFVGWAGVGFLAGGLLARVTDRVTLLFGLATISAFFEVGQHYLTSSRSAELSDLMANGAGLTLGFVCYALLERTVVAFFPDLGVWAAPLARRRLRFG